MSYLRERIGASNANRKTQTEIDGILDDSWKDSPPYVRLYQLFLLVQESQKRLQIYKKSTQKLVQLCEAYARHSLDRTVNVTTSDGQFESISVWFLDTLSVLRKWSPLVPLLLLLNHSTIRRDLNRIARTIPSEIVHKAIKDNPRIQKAIVVEFEETFETFQEVVSSRDEVEAIVRLNGADAQSFIDLLDKTMDDIELESEFYSRCLRTLRRLCGRSGKLPTSYILSDGLEKVGTEARTSGGFADIWLGKYKGRTVALKVLRVYGTDNIKTVKKRFCREAVLWKRLSHPNIIPFLGASTTLFPLCMVCEWMARGNIVTYLKRNPTANRLILAIDIARGLQFLHSIGILHGDLKGANILINDDLHACLSDFGLTAVIYDPNTVNAITASSTALGSCRWMAPEVFHPEQSGLEQCQPRPESDMYGFAMTLWEVFAGHVPFYQFSRDATVLFKVALGIRPERPHEATALGLSDTIWSMMEMCWQAEWHRRPRVLFVLQCLEEAASQFVPSSGSQPVQPAFIDEPDEAVDSDGSSDDEGDGAPFSQDFTVSRESQSNVLPGPPPAFATVSHGEVQLALSGKSNTPTPAHVQTPFFLSDYAGRNILDAVELHSDMEQLTLDRGSTPKPSSSVGWDSISNDFEWL